jgi:hypothetical protein
MNDIKKKEQLPIVHVAILFTVPLERQIGLVTIFSAFGKHIYFIAWPYHSKYIVDSCINIIRTSKYIVIGYLKYHF